MEWNQIRRRLHVSSNFVSEANLGQMTEWWCRGSECRSGTRKIRSSIIVVRMENLVVEKRKGRTFFERQFALVSPFSLRLYPFCDLLNLSSLCRYPKLRMSTICAFQLPAAINLSCDIGFIATVRTESIQKLSMHERLTVSPLYDLQFCSWKWKQTLSGQNLSVLDWWKLFFFDS